MPKKPIHPKPGQPPLWNRDRAERLIALLRAGNYIDTACQALGIHGDTLRGWSRASRKGAGLFVTVQDVDGRTQEVEFFEAVSMAYATPETIDNERLDRIAGSEDLAAATKAITWRLARRNPKRYSERITVEVESELNAVLDALEKRLDPEVYTLVLEAISNARLGAETARELSGKDGIE
jgi:hypothetical protein